MLKQQGDRQPPIYFRFRCSSVLFKRQVQHLNTSKHTSSIRSHSHRKRLNFKLSIEYNFVLAKGKASDTYEPARRTKCHHRVDASSSDTTYNVECLQCNTRKKNSILNQVDALQTCGSAFTDGDHDDHPYDV